MDHPAFKIRMPIPSPIEKPVIIGNGKMNHVVYLFLLKNKTGSCRQPWAKQLFSYYPAFPAVIESRP
jgi:hypothetical protein